MSCIGSIRRVLGVHRKRSARPAISPRLSAEEPRRRGYAVTTHLVSLAAFALLGISASTSCTGCPRPAAAQEDGAPGEPTVPGARVPGPGMDGPRATDGGVIDDGFPRAAAFDEDDDEEDDGGTPGGADAGPAQADGGVGAVDAGAPSDALDAGAPPEEGGDAGEAAADAGVAAALEETGDAGPQIDQAIIDEIVRLRPVTPEDLNLSTDPNQSRTPFEVAVTQEVRAALANDEELSDQARTDVYVTTINETIVLQGEVPSERERSLIQDKIEELTDDRFPVTNMLVVRDRGVE